MKRLKLEKFFSKKTLEKSLVCIFVFDSELYKKKEFKKNLLKALNKAEKDGVTKTEGMVGKYPKLTLSGKLIPLAKVNQRIRKFFDARGIYLSKDEPSDVFRRKSYRYLSAIELGLRRFLWEACTQTIGFHWWEDLSGVQSEKIEKFDKKYNSGEISRVHPLELMLYEQLINFISHDIDQYHTKRPIDLSTLQELIAVSEDFNSLKQNLTDRFQKKNIWGEVISQFSDNENSWKDLIESLHKTIELRNNTMHHRYIDISSLGTLHETYIKLTQFTKDNPIQKQRPLTEEERESRAASVRKMLDESLGGTFWGGANPEGMASWMVPAIIDDWRRKVSLSLNPAFDALAKIDIGPSISSPVINALTSAYPPSINVLQDVTGLGKISLTDRSPYHLSDEKLPLSGEDKDSEGE